MVRVSITADELTVRILGLHQVLAFRRQIGIPLDHVRGATVDPGITQESRGIRAPGTRIPGVTLGTYYPSGYRTGPKTFWDVVGSRHVIVIELVDEDYERLIVDVRDPRSTVDEINQALTRIDG